MFVQISMWYRSKQATKNRSIGFQSAQIQRYVLCHFGHRVCNQYVTEARLYTFSTETSARGL